MELCSYFIIAIAQKYYKGYICCFIHILLTKNCITIMQDIRDENKSITRDQRNPYFLVMMSRFTIEKVLLLTF